MRASGIFTYNYTQEIRKTENSLDKLAIRWECVYTERNLKITTYWEKNVYKAYI